MPVGRAIANRHTRRLFGILGGFVQTQMLAAALELGVFDALRDGPLPIADLSAALGLPEPSGAALLQALLAIGLVERRRGGRVALTIDGLVVATDPGIRAMIAHGALLYADLVDPVAMLRAPGSGRLAAFWPYAGSGGDAPGYSALMAASQGFVADALLASVDFGRFAQVMDVGGGDGDFLARLAARERRPRLTLVDLPPVATVARAALAKRGLLDRIAVEGRTHDAALPTGADAITLIRVLHDADDAAARALLRRAAAALAPGGTLIVAEPMAQAGLDPQTAYFAAYFVAMGSGRLRTRAEIESLLRSAGLTPTGHHRPAMLVDVITAGQAPT